MFSKNFPDVKSPEQIAFKGKVGEIITRDEIDLDDLLAADFLTSDEDEQDDKTFIKILEEMNCLGSVPETKKGKLRKAKRKMLKVERNRRPKQRHQR